MPRPLGVWNGQMSSCSHLKQESALRSRGVHWGVYNAECAIPHCFSGLLVVLKFECNISRIHLRQPRTVPRFGLFHLEKGCEKQLPHESCIFPASPARHIHITSNVFNTKTFPINLCSIPAHSNPKSPRPKTAPRPPQATFRRTNALPVTFPIVLRCCLSTWRHPGCPLRICSFQHHARFNTFLQ